MKILRTVHRLCTCCMEVHDVKTVSLIESNTYKGITVEYEVEYEYCDFDDTLYANEDQMSRAHKAMRKAYEEKTKRTEAD